MRASSSRAIALVLVAILALPVAPLESLHGGPSTAAAQGEQFTLPVGVAWRDWEADHILYAHLPGGLSPNGNCVDNTQAPPVATPAGDINCPLALNTSEPTQTGSGFSLNPRTTVGLNNPSPTDTDRAWIRLDPALAEPINVTSGSAAAYASFNPPLTSCRTGGLDTPGTGKVTVIFNLYALQQGQDQVSHTLVLSGSETHCPVDESGQTTSTANTIFRLTSALSAAGQQHLDRGQKLQLSIAMKRPVSDSAAGTWILDFDSTSSPTGLTVHSSNAFQYAAWTTDKTGKLATTFPLPVQPADRFSTQGWLGIKDAFGGYDNPPAQETPMKTRDARWAMQVIAPSGQAVHLRDPNFLPTPPESEFTNCDGENVDNNAKTCLEEQPGSPDNVVRIWHMPTRPAAQGSGPAWNYTLSQINQIAPAGGEFTIPITGAIRGISIANALAGNNALKFSVGGFGVRLNLLQQGTAQEANAHTVTPGRATTFLLNAVNLATRQDNFTLSSSFLSCNPGCPGWGVGFGGPGTRGGNTLVIGASNSTLLKATISPPSSATAGGAATLKLRAQSQSSPDQFAEIQLTVQVSTTLQRGVSVFLFPDIATKSLRRGESQTFNFTVWNRGTDQDAFSVTCDSGPDPTLTPDGRPRDEWSGTIRSLAQTIGCKDTNATATLVANVAPGDSADVQVVLRAPVNNSGDLRKNVAVKALSQGDASKSDIASALAQIETRKSFKLTILTTDPDNPLSEVQATQILRFGKDDPTVCPNIHVPDISAGQCSGAPPAENTTPYTEDYNADDGDAGIVDPQHPSAGKQRLDPDFTEYAYYRLTIFNDGDVSGAFTPKLGRVENTSLEAATGCTADSFTASRLTSTAGPNVPIGMGDTNGVVLLHSPTLRPVATDNFTVTDMVNVDPGKQAVFYLRVHTEWNRFNLSMLGGGGGNTICDSQSKVPVIVTAAAQGFDQKGVIAYTRTIQHVSASDASNLPRSVIVTQGRRVDANGGYEADLAQSCPPVTPADSPDKRFCKYIKPGGTVDWYFTGNLFWGSNDDFSQLKLRRAGDFALTELQNRGWQFSAPTIEPAFSSDTTVSARGAYASGAEVTVRVHLVVPTNATIADFADLQVGLGGSRVEARSLLFYTIGAQKFNVSLRNLAGAIPIEIHPGGRAAVNLNVSNGGAAPDLYNVSILGSLPDGWSQRLQPNETRIPASHNKTITVFLQAPSTGQFPQTLTRTIRVRSLSNQSSIRTSDEATFADANFTVLAKDRIADNVGLSVVDSDVKTMKGGDTVTFLLNVSNPAPNEKLFTLRRLPSTSVLAEFVNGWVDNLGETCFNVAARSSKQVSFTITAAVDALEGTYVSYVLRADEATGSVALGCQPLTQNANFEQTIATAQVIGLAGLEIQSLDAVKVVPRGNSVSFPVRIRNIGTAGDNFVFQSTFVNQSQTQAPSPWAAEVRTSEGELAQTLFVDPQTSRIVFVNVTAPLDVQTTGVRADIDFVVRSSTGASPGGVRLSALVQDYDIRIRISNATADAAPGEAKQFTLNLTNAGNGLDTFDIVVDVGGLAGYWNVSREPAESIRLLNGTSKDVLITVQVPKSPLPTTGAVIGVQVRSAQVEALRPAAETLGLGSPLVQYLTSATKSGLISVNLYPYVSFDIDGDRDPELALDRNKNARDGFEVFYDPFGAIVQSNSVLEADGDGDGKIDHFVDINGNGRPDRYWDPDNTIVTAIAENRLPDVNNDGTLEFLYDSDGDLSIDHWIDPATRRIGRVWEKDYNDDGSPEYLIDTNGDGRPDKYFDPARGARGLVSDVNPVFASDQRYAIDTNGDGRADKVYDTVTGEVLGPLSLGFVEFAASYWYLVLLFIVLAIVAAWLIVQRRKGRRPRA